MDVNSSMEKNGSHNGDVCKHYRVSPLAQALLEKHDIPFVGLQYVVEVQQSENADVDSSYYVCALCGKKMSSKTLVAHVKSVPHRLKFTEHHCPKLHATYGTIQIKEWTAALVKEFSEEMVKVSKSMGNFQMAVCKEPEMNSLLAVIKENIGNLDKFRSFRGTADAADASKGSNGRDKGKASGLSHFLKQKLKQGLKRDSPAGSQARGQDRSPSVHSRDGPSPKKIRSDSVGPSSGSAHTRRGSRSPSARNASPSRPSRHDGDRSAAVAAFRKDFENFYSRHMEREMYYKKNPESHPEYSSEWKMFWERRYQELAAKGLNPNRHDFKSEWAMFWNDRMKDIFSTTVENKKDALLRKHKICKADLEEKRPVSPWECSDSLNIDKNDFSVIGTLKALIAVEALLGAFGPAVNTLLKKALSHQSEGRNPWDIFSDSDSVTLMKLSLDKLSGTINSESNPSSALRKHAIECSKWLLAQVGLEKSEEKFLGLNVKEIAEKTLGMDTVQIAQQIALALLKIGKSNASEDDLQKILLSVSASHAKLLMEKQSSQPSTSFSSQNMTRQTAGSKPLFPSAAFSLHAKESSSVKDSEVTLANQKKSPSPNDVCKSSGALGQLMSAYDDEEPVRDMEKLSLDDLVNLLSNFKDLSVDEQRALTAYLKRLEATDTKKVTKLRELVQKKRETLAREKETAEANSKKDKSKILSSSEKGSAFTHARGESSGLDHSEIHGNKGPAEVASSVSNDQSVMQNEIRAGKSEPNGQALHQESYSSCPRPLERSPASREHSLVRSSRERSGSRTRDSQETSDREPHSLDNTPFLRSNSVHRSNTLLDSRGDILLHNANEFPPGTASFQNREVGDQDCHPMQSFAVRSPHAQESDNYQRGNYDNSRAGRLPFHGSIRDIPPIYPGDGHLIRPQDDPVYTREHPMHSRIDDEFHYRGIDRPLHRVHPREGHLVHGRNGPEHPRDSYPHPRDDHLGHPVDDSRVELRGGAPPHLRHGSPGEDQRMRGGFTTYPDNIRDHRWSDRENFRDETRMRPLMELDLHRESFVHSWEGSHAPEERLPVDRRDGVQHSRMDPMRMQHDSFFPRDGRPVDAGMSFKPDSFNNPRNEQLLRPDAEIASSNPRVRPCPIGPLDPAIASNSYGFGDGRPGSVEVFDREPSNYAGDSFAHEGIRPVSRQHSHDGFERDSPRSYPMPREDPRSDHPFDRFIMDREAESHGTRPQSWDRCDEFPPRQPDRTSGQFPYRR